MKFLYIALLTLSLSASAEPITITSTMPCDDTKIVTDYLTKNYKEIPLLVGKTEDEVGSLMSFWVNRKTGTWTIIATKDKLSCIIGVGKSLKVIDSGPTV